MSEWISVDERLPEKEDVFLCWSKPLSDMFFCFTSDFNGMEVTHWMPLPEPPVATASKTERVHKEG